MKMITASHDSSLNNFYEVYAATNGTLLFVKNDKRVCIVPMGSIDLDTGKETRYTYDEVTGRIKTSLLKMTGGDVKATNAMAADISITLMIDL